MYKVLKREQIVPNIHHLVLASTEIYKNAKDGEFVVVRVSEFGERIPLNLVDWNNSSVGVVFMEVGTSTRKLANLHPGDEIATLVGPLGRPTEMVQDKKILMIGGCYGIGALLPVIRAFKKNNNRIITAIEARSSFLLYWQDRLKEYSDELHQIIRDGTKNIEVSDPKFMFSGHIDKFLNEFLSQNTIDLVYCQGCTYLTYLVSQATKPFGIKTIVGLNPIMIDATGMCGVCRVIIGGQTKFACVDGPEFDGHQVDWENLLARRRTYFDQEQSSLSFYECENYG